MKPCVFFQFAAGASLKYFEEAKVKFALSGTPIIFRLHIGVPLLPTLSVLNDSIGCTPQEMEMVIPAIAKSNYHIKWSVDGTSCEVTSCST